MHGRIAGIIRKGSIQGRRLGDDTFKDRLLDLLETAVGRRPASQTGKLVADHGLKKAESLVKHAASLLELSPTAAELSKLPKGEKRKVVVAMALRKQTIAGNQWIADRLAMGAAGSVSRLVGKARTNKTMKKELAELESMLKSED